MVAYGEQEEVQGLCQFNLGGTEKDRRREHMGPSLDLAGGSTAGLLRSVLGLVQMQAAVLRLALGVSGCAVARLRRSCRLQPATCVACRKATL